MTQEFHDRYAAARRAVIARRYQRMNPRQQEAVLATEGPITGPDKTKEGSSMLNISNYTKVYPGGKTAVDGLTLYRSAIRFR